MLPIMNTDGDRIRQLRLRAGLTLRGLADAAEVDKGNLSRVETSDAGMSPAALGRVARELHVDLSEISPDVHLEAVVA